MKEEKGFLFDGFNVKITLVKSRANKSGQSTILPYSQVNGFMKTYHLYDLLDRQNMLKGSRSPHYYIEGHDDIKFGKKNFIKKFNENDKFKEIVLQALTPYLESLLSKADDGSDIKDEFDFAKEGLLKNDSFNIQI